MSIETGGAAQDLDRESVPVQGTSSPTPGELLKTARAERNLSIQQIADDLHLDVRVVEALESNNFALLGPPVYSRGHLRKYATLVGLSPDVVISHYETLTDVPAVPEPVPASVIAPPPERVSLRGPLLIAAGIAVTVLALWIAGWLINRFGSSADVPVESSPPSVAAEKDSPAPPAAPVPDEAAVEASPPPAPAAQSQVANAGNDVTMRLHFSEPSWVEIYDATDRRLMFGIGQAGQVSTLAGQPPLRVTLGMASAVSMEINDRTVPVPRRAGKDAARFTVAADGSVR